MIELTPPGRGQVVSHGLYPASELVELRAAFAGPAGRSARWESDDRASGASSATSAAEAPPGAGLAEVSAEVAQLRAEVARLGERLRMLEARIDADRR
jgi:hypothetical protein